MPAVAFSLGGFVGGVAKASIGHDAGGKRRILFYAVDGSRKTIRLGKFSKRDAETVKIRVEQLLSAQIVGCMSTDLSFWIAELDPRLRRKLEAVGLLEPTEAPEPEPEPVGKTLAEFLTGFMERRGPTKKPATRVVWQQVINLLNQYMPEGILLSDVTAGHAKRFAEQLRERGLASTTIHKRVGFARQFFDDALDWELIGKNPFAKVKTQGTSAKSNVDVPRETIDRVMQHCDPTWQTIVALSRFGGLRTPSETLSLKWGHIDWEAERMHVPECKVEHHEGRGIREVPIFGELRPFLEAAFHAASVDGQYPSAEAYVVDKQAYRDAAIREGGWANANLRTQFCKILKRANIEAWARLFHSMRASRQTELEREFPRHVVCAWMGNSSAVAAKSYLLVIQADFSQASKSVTDEPEKRGTKSGTIGSEKGSKSGTIPAPQPARKGPQVQKETPQNTGGNSVSTVFYGVPEMEDNGLEPMTSTMPL